MTWLTKKQVLSMTRFYLVFIFARILFFAFVINYFKCALLALPFKKVNVRVWIFWLVFFITFQSHFEKSCRRNLCSSLSLKDWPDLILGFALKFVKISCVCVCLGVSVCVVGSKTYLLMTCYISDCQYEIIK